jgi:predicted RNA-binding Zn-ribbon protein involved in translation (DUF1610 family)
VGWFGGKKRALQSIPIAATVGASQYFIKINAAPQIAEWQCSWGDRAGDAMPNETNNAAQTLLQCWSCNAEIVPTNIFCPNCGTWLLANGRDQKDPTTTRFAKSRDSISAENKPRIAAGKIIIGGELLLLGGWVLLQLFVGKF